MREIKFRVWNIFEKGMFDATDSSWSLKTWTARPDNFIVMQYTGRKDKYGVNIWEGDIVSFMWKDPNDEKAKRKATFCSIVWNDNCAAFTLKWPNGYLNNYFLNPSAYEVVGNIYANPELLK